MKKNSIKCIVVLALYLAFLFWVGSWWGLIVVPFIFDAYITKKVPWTWWKKSTNKSLRTVMSWIDAIVFALVAVYFVNLYFFQNYVIPSSSLEKSLLVGDYLFVSKMSYGPRVPQTPLTMPLTAHTLPVLNCKSYLEWPQWDYRRIKGFGPVRLNDIVVFNYPSGDTVALNIQDRDFYGTCYMIGSQMFPEHPDVSMPFSQQQAIYNSQYTAGRDYIKANYQMFGEIVSRPVDRRENYVKRCVGMPGQTLQIKNNIVYLDGKPNKEPDNVQYRYLVRFKQTNPANLGVLFDISEDHLELRTGIQMSDVCAFFGLPEQLVHELGISMEDLSSIYAADGTVGLPLTKHALNTLRARPDLVKSIHIMPSSGDGLYPLNMAKKWTSRNYGPLWIPKKGVKMPLTLENLPIYERPIRVYEGNDLQVRDGKIYINGNPADSYTFKLDYYWMMGDNRDNSADSRYWGFVPEDHVVGKPIMIWLSLDKDYGWFDGKIRWKRLFRWVDNIK